MKTKKKLRQVTLAGTRRAAIRCYVQIQDINAWFDLENIKNKNLSNEFNFWNKNLKKKIKTTLSTGVGVCIEATCDKVDSSTQYCCSTIECNNWSKLKCWNPFKDIAVPCENTDWQCKVRSIRKTCFLFFDSSNAHFTANNIWPSSGIFYVFGDINYFRNLTIIIRFIILRNPKKYCF